VALKLIKSGMDTRQVLARFDAERQALALMNHPNIANVYDGGATALGRPYFVMELVKGIPITKYCDEHQLTPRQRLELFVPVCHAIQHAHQKGIIHRDIKPSNVLVAMYDDRPVPKVIDFGVAKATGPQLTDESAHTGFGAVVGTVEYMSPEQANFNQLDVDTRSDVYSLGVLLYELLAGSPPFSRKETDAGGLLETLRVIREQEPPRPSHRLSSAEGLPALAAKRGTEPAKLARLVRGELDWIVLKALEKDRGRRYETANNLATDIERYLADEPVAAGPPSRPYRLRKFVRRNRRVLSVLSGFVALLVASVVILAVALVKIYEERQQKEAALEAESQRRQATRKALDSLSSKVIEDWFMRQVVLTPEQNQLLVEALNYYEDFAADTGQSEESRAGVASAYRRVGRIRQLRYQFDEALAAWERSRDLWAALATKFPASVVYQRELAGSYFNLTLIYNELLRHADADTACRQALAIRERLAADWAADAHHQDDLADSIHQLGQLLLGPEIPQETESLLRRALSIRQQLIADMPTSADYRRKVGQTCRSLAIILAYSHRFDEAAALSAKALALQNELIAEFPNNPHDRQLLARSHVVEFHLHYHSMNFRPAADACSQSIAILTKLVADYPAQRAYSSDLAESHVHMAHVYIREGRTRDALDEFDRAIAILERLTKEEPRYRGQLAEALHDLGSHYDMMKRWVEAEDALLRAHAIFEKLVAAYPTVRNYRLLAARTSNGLGILLKNTNRLRDAEKHLRLAVTMRRELLAESQRKTLYRRDLVASLNNLANVLRDSDQPQQAEEFLREALVEQTKVVAEMPDEADFRNQLAGTMVNLGRFLHTRKKYEEARQLFVDAVPHHLAALGVNPRYMPYRSFYRNNRRRLAETLVELKDHAGAAATVSEYIEAAVEPDKDLFNAACLLAACATLSASDEGIEASKRKALTESYADRAVATFRLAIDKGFRDTAQARSEAGLNAIRSRSDFQKLLAELDGKGKKQ
jgi:serine/threonine protein kinase